MYIPNVRVSEVLQCDLLAWRLKTLFEKVDSMGQKLKILCAHINLSCTTLQI